MSDEYGFKKLHLQWEKEKAARDACPSGDIQTLTYEQISALHIETCMGVVAQSDDWGSWKQVGAWGRLVDDDGVVYEFSNGSNEEKAAEDAATSRAWHAKRAKVLSGTSTWTRREL